MLQITVVINKILPITCIQLVRQHQVHCQCSGCEQTSLEFPPTNFEPTMCIREFKQAYTHGYSYNMQYSNVDNWP